MVHCPKADVPLCLAESRPVLSMGADLSTLA